MMRGYRGFKKAFYLAGITNRQVAEALGVSEGYIHNVFSGFKLSLSAARRIWPLLPRDQRTPELAFEVCEMILQDKQILEICSIDKYRAFAYFEFR